jgi:hypothetical protein
MLESINKDEIILALETESKMLDPKTQSYVHHAEDFRWMLKVVGDEIPDNHRNHCIQGALGRADENVPFRAADNCWALDNCCEMEVCGKGS